MHLRNEASGGRQGALGQVAYMKRIWRELFPGNLVTVLEELHVEALSLMRRLRARRNPMDLQPVQELAEEAQRFFNHVRERDGVLTVARGTRVLRFGAGQVWGIDPSARGPSLEDTISWMDRVIENLEHVLDVIDRKRILWWTLIAAVAAAIAALFALLSLLKS
jgi:hypothetical protein